MFSEKTSSSRLDSPHIDFTQKMLQLSQTYIYEY